MAKVNKWATPDSMDNYTRVPECAGVYILKVINTTTLEKYIAYVGSSSNLRKRRDNHPVISKLYKRHPNSHLVAFYFKPMTNGYIAYEKILIERLHPKFNVQHNGVKIY